MLQVEVWRRHDVNAGVGPTAEIDGHRRPSSTATVAEELVELCRAGRNLDAIAKLYSPKIVSIEPIGSERCRPR